MSPDGSGVAKAREGHMVEQIKMVRLMEPLDHFPGRALPQQIVKFNRVKLPFEIEQGRRLVVVNKHRPGV